MADQQNEMGIKAERTGGRMMNMYAYVCKHV